MQKKSSVILAGAAAVAVTVIGFSAWNSVVGAYAADMVSAPAMFGAAKFTNVRGRHWRRHLCGDEMEEKMEKMLGFVADVVTVKPEQKDSWEKLTTSVQDAGGTIKEACREFDTGDEVATAPERLARMEKMALAGVAVVQKIRPDFDAFYTILDDDQKKRIDALSSWRRHRRH